MAEETEAEAGESSPGAAEPEPKPEKKSQGAGPAPPAPGDDDMLRVLTDIRDGQRKALEHQSQFLWILIPIFALLCVQIVLELIR